MNVAPPKPTRILPEAERKEMLNHDMSPETPVTPLMHNHLETSPIIFKPNNSHVVQVADQVPNNNGWDTATEELLLSLDRQHLFPSLYDNPNSIIDLDSDWVQAPLATPEILSAASSMSALSRTCSVSTKGEHKSESMSGRLEAIKQSPDIQSRSVSSVQDSVDDLQETLSEMDSIKVDKIPACKSIGDLMLQRGDDSSVPVLDISKGSMANLLANTDDRDVENVTIECKSGKSISFDPTIVRINSSPVVCSRFMEDTDMVNNVEEIDSNIDANDKPICFQSCTVENEVKDVEDVYERHSPVETNQFGYANPNEVYSPASIGYIPHYNPGLNCNCEDNPSVVIETKQDVPNSPRTPDKRLHYSQSESKLKGLSDQFQMKRSTEEGDIAHLEDTSKVFVGERLKKILKQRGSEPAFDKESLPKLENRLESVIEHQNSLVEQENAACSPEETENSNTIHEQDQEVLKKNRKLGMDIAKVDHENTYVDSDNDKTCLLIKDRISTSEEKLNRNNLSGRNSVGSTRSSPGRTPEEEDMRLFHSQSCHSTFNSSVSGGSEQRLSLISANSDDFPIVETDV